MERSRFSGTIVLGEGSSDHRLLRGFIDPQRCKLLVSHGRTNVLGCISLASPSELTGVVAFTDADHDRLLGLPTSGPHLVCTDYYDCEILMASSPAFDKIVGELSSAKKLKGLLAKVKVSSLRDLVFSACRPMGMLRLLSRKNNWNLCFKGLSCASYIDGRDLTPRVKALVTAVLANTPGHNLSATQVLKDLQSELRANSHDSRDLCNGHDFAETLGLSFRQAAGTKPRSVTTREHIEILLRLAYEFAHFRSSRCYQDLISWVSRNSGFQIF